MRQEHGVSLIELIAYIAIVSMVVAWGVPAMSGLMAETRLTAQTNLIISSLHFARSSAIRLGDRVTLCPSEDQEYCAEVGYEQGWIVFHDPDGDTVRQAGEPLLATQAAEGPAGLTIRGNAPLASYISYTAMGYSEQLSGAFQAGSFRLCLDGRGRRIVVARGGRPRVVKESCPSSD